MTIQQRRAPGGATVQGPVQVHLEELGQHSWTRGLFNTLGGTSGSVQYRFVVSPDGHERADEHVAVSGTFPMMRWADLDDTAAAGAWAGLARDQLHDLDAVLRARGWVRRDDGGRHWWSLRYDAPAPRPHGPAER